MRKREELTNPNSCLNKAHEEEFIFVLLERDEDAPETVLEWIRLRVRNGRNKWTDTKIVSVLRWVADVLESQRGIEEKYEYNCKTVDPTRQC